MEGLLSTGPTPSGYKWVKGFIVGKVSRTPKGSWISLKWVVYTTLTTFKSKTDICPSCYRVLVTKSCPVLDISAPKLPVNDMGLDSGLQRLWASQERAVQCRTLLFCPHWTPLYCLGFKHMSVLHRTLVYNTVLLCTALLYTVMNYFTLAYTALHCTDWRKAVRTRSRRGVLHITETR